MYVKKRVLSKQPVSIGNSKGFRIKKDEFPLSYFKDYYVIIIEKNSGD